MRASVASLGQKLISTLFAATLAVGLVPAAAFADVGESENSEAADAARIDRASDESDAYENDATTDSSQDESVGASFMRRDGEEEPQANASTGEDATSAILANDVINQTLPLETVAQQESTRSYFLAQTLESTKTIPMVSANLPLDEGVAGEVVESNNEATPEDEGGEDSDESDLAPAPIASESTVIGSFTSRGLTYAVEPGGETVALVAADYNQLPQEYLEAQTIVVPAAVTPDAIDYYSVTRLADYSFANLPTQKTTQDESVGASFMWRDGEGETEANAEASAATSTLDSSDGASEDAPTCITTLTIPESVTTIDTNAFTDFATLQYLVVSPVNPQYSSYDGALYDADQNRLLLIPEGRLGAVRVAPSVTEVDPEAFSHCPSVETLVADANSAAYQLLSENDFHNANGNAIEVIATNSAQDHQTPHQPLYEELVSVLNYPNALGVDKDVLPETTVMTLDSAASYGAPKNTYPIKLVLSWPGEPVEFKWGRYDRFRPSGSTDGSNDVVGPTEYVTFTAGDTINVFQLWLWDVSATSISYYSYREDKPEGVYQTLGYMNPVIPGYHASAWQLDGKTLPAGNTWPSKAGELSPVMEANPYTIAYNGNGNTSGSTPSTAATYDQNVKLAANGFTKTGFTFQGWNKKKDGTGDNYTAGQTLTKPNFTTSNNGTFTLYAHWKATLKPGDFTDQQVDVTWNAPLPDKDVNGDPLVAPRREGYEFAGIWSTDYDESDPAKQYYTANEEGHLAPIEGKVWDIDKLYAHWKYKVVLNLNTYDGYGQLALVEDEDGTKRFEASIPESSYASVTKTSIGTPAVDVEVYTFDAIDGSPITLPAATRTGYADATHWKTTGGTAYSGTTAPFTSEVVDTDAEGAYDAKALVLFADWEGKANTYDVTLTSDYDAFKAAGGHTTSIKARYDAPLLKVEGDKVVTWAEGKEVKAPWIKNSDGTYAYAFAGYYDQTNTLDTANGTRWMGATPVTGATGYEGAAVAPTDVIYRIAGTTELYARWTRVESGLTLNLQGGALNGQTGTVKVEDFALTANQRVSELPSPYNYVPVRQGYEFVGWWSASAKAPSAYATYAQDDTTKCYYATQGATVRSTGEMWPYYTDTTLYAHWKYRLSFAANADGDAAAFTYAVAGEGAPSSGDMPQFTANGDAYEDAYGNLYTFKGADATSEINYITVIDGTPVALPSFGERKRGAALTGYSLAGFYPSPACEGEALTGATLAANVAVSGQRATLYAGWTAHAYEVALKANSYEDFAYGSLVQDTSVTPAATVTATYDMKLPDAGAPQGSAIVPKMRGYEFLGYYDAPQTDIVDTEAKKVTYRPSATRFYNASGVPAETAWTKTADTDLVLYAHYYRIPYALSFELGTSQTLDVTVGGTVRASIGATGARTASITVHYGMPMAELVAKPYREGYEFIGWKMKDTDAHPDYFSEEGIGRASYLTEGDTTLTPSWDGKTYKITWHLDYEVPNTQITYDHWRNAGYDGVKVTDVGWADKVDIPDPRAFPAYAFRGWYTSARDAYQQNPTAEALAQYFEADGVTFRPKDDKDVSDLDFFASWDPTPVRYTVTILPGDKSSFANAENKMTFERAYGDSQGPVRLSVATDELIERAQAGWAFAGWMETTGGTPGTAYQADIVPLGTGNRTFTAQWEADTALASQYSIAFLAGQEVSDPVYYHDWASMMHGGTSLFDKERVKFSVEEPFAFPVFELNGATVKETLGYVFEGWRRADNNWNVIENEGLLDPDAKAWSGQDLATIARDAGTTSLKYVAQWAPKDFDVVYRYSADDETLMEKADYDSATLSYADEVTLASPVFDRGKDAPAAIFKHWTGASNGAELAANKTYRSVADLLLAAGKDSAQDGQITLRGVWADVTAYSFTVPLSVNIAIDPERSEGTVKGEGFIRTTSTTPLFVESVTFTRADGAEELFEVAGQDRTPDVSLAIAGGNVTDALKVSLADAKGIYTKDYDSLADHGLTSVNAANPLSVTYDLAINEGADVKFTDFAKLLEKKDERDSNKNLLTDAIGRVMYTLSMG